MFPPVHHRPEQMQPLQPVYIVLYELLIDGPRKGKGAPQDQLVGFQGNEQMIQLGEQAEDTGDSDRARQIEQHEVGFAVAGGKVRTAACSPSSDVERTTGQILRPVRLNSRTIMRL